jgi:hypothetical protein
MEDRTPDMMEGRSRMYANKRGEAMAAKRHKKRKKGGE